MDVSCFRNLKDQILWGNLILIDQVGYFMNKSIDLPKMDRWDVEGQRNNLLLFLHAFGQPQKGSFINVIVQCFHFTGLLKDWQKTVGKPERTIIFLPSDKHFRTGNLLGFSVDFWLEIELKFFLLQCIAEGMNGFSTFLFVPCNIFRVFTYAWKFGFGFSADNIGMWD